MILWLQLPKPKYIKKFLLKNLLDDYLEWQKNQLQIAQNDEGSTKTSTTSQISFLRSDGDELALQLFDSDQRDHDCNTSG